MYGVKLSQENKNEDFAEWAEKEDAKKKKAAEGAANAVEQSYEDFKKNLPAESEKKPIKVSPYTTIKSPYEGESPNKKADTKGERVEIPAESFEEGKRIYETRQKGAGQPGIVSEVKKALTNILNSIGGQHAVVSNNTEFGRKPYVVMVNMNVAGKLAGDPNPSAEKFAVLKNIDSIIENAAYMGSGDYVRHGTKNKNVTRYDYFETEVNINGKPYVVAFDVEVVPGKNNYRTHKVLNEINLMETSTGETRPRRVAEDATPGLQGTNSALSVESSPRLDAQGTESSSLGDVPSPNNSITDTSENFKSKSENSAAKAQQAETEEEARLRTLYESEPTGKYEGTEAGESKAELDEKVKEAKENAVGDDELKEKPKTEKQKILKRRIEKAGLDMTVEEIVGFAQGLGRIKGFFGSERKDFARIFDDVSEGSRTIRNDLHKLLEVPHRQAQAQYTESYKNAVKAISDKFIIPSTFLFMPQNPFRHIPNRLLDGAWVVAEAPCGGLVAEHAV